MMLADNNICTGCGACASVCPCNAISMKPDMEGFYYPHIVTEKCTNCRLCEKICPALKKNGTTFEQSTFFALWTNDKKERIAASSGGAFGEIAKWVLENDGIVFGAAFSDDYKSLSHISTDEIHLDRLKKSKYIESDMNFTIKRIKEELEKGRWVFFCGTPCQAMGVRSVCTSNDDKLIVADFLCHGVPSQKAYRKYISELEEKYKSKVQEVSFRSKKLGWKAYCMFITFENGKKYFKTAIEDPFYKLFLRRLTLRNSCYGCTRAEESVADITLGDFWGITNTAGIVDTDEGISLVLVHNEKGKQIIDEIKSNLTVFGLPKENVEYIREPKKNCKRETIDYEKFNFFNNSLLSKNNMITFLKSVCLKNKYIRHIRYKKRF